ncbi:TIGR04282 family arsenosugar biosynthesis glycosyltransferase [Falsihalocynthiibacter sp. S25ZX9]
MRKQLIVMLKVPHAGRVKTRLGADMGMVGAAWWFRHQVRNLLRRLEDPKWDLILAVSPDIEGLKSRVWPAHLPRISQGQGNLGDRMARVFRDLPAGPVLIIGGDIPGIQKRHITEAFAALGNHQAVFGPAPDGGYWLVGMKRVAAIPAAIFRNVRWSSETALADSRASLSGLSIAEISVLQDVDTVSDLELLAE